ncbi:AraC family transcriptional regulator [Kribbella antibiotica]|uniref:AraC family transcriptional regulator n=1 Tax=Kribbella antibiotica TaxID=190195 RepID=A0A4R4ZQK8_9ACTN|nr:AraC family transcriptional regulator [Kribbella antibiotica]TDD60466.1 AraC family transcriptional regulator [Kribbella antibiotica]
MIIHRELPLTVPRGARGAIESMVKGDLRDSGQVVLEGPDHAVTLALRLDEGFSADALVVMGARTRAVYHAAAPGRSWLKLRLKTEAVQGLLGGAASELVDQAVPLAAVTGDRVARRLMAEGPQTLLAALSVDARTDRTTLVRRATRMLANGMKVAEVAQRVHLSERQLRTVFVGTLGISPKQFARIYRVRTVIDRAEQQPLAQVALEAGYYDQAHLTAEFKIFRGVPPAAFAQGKMPAATACQSPV